MNEKQIALAAARRACNTYRNKKKTLEADIRQEFYSRLGNVKLELAEIMQDARKAGVSVSALMECYGTKDRATVNNILALAPQALSALVKVQAVAQLPVVAARKQSG